MQFYGDQANKPVELDERTLPKSFYGMVVELASENYLRIYRNSELIMYLYLDYSMFMGQAKI